MANVESNYFYSKPNKKSEPNYKSFADVLPNEKFEPNVNSAAHIHTYKRKSNGKFQAFSVHGQHPRLG